MRNKIILGTVVTSILALPAIAAAEGASREEKIGVGTGATIGAIAGGPVGLIIGAAIGAKVGDEFYQRNDEIDTLDSSLTTTQARADRLQGDLDARNRDIDQVSAELQQMKDVARPELLSLLQAGIEMDLLFRTDEHVLADASGSRLEQLAASLARMPDVHVQLDGFADERGDATYNQELSSRRVQYVHDLLVNAGVDPSRIKQAAHGEAPAAEKTVDSFALQRKVSLRLYVDGAPSFANN